MRENKSPGLAPGAPAEPIVPFCHDCRNPIRGHAFWDGEVDPPRAHCLSCAIAGGMTFEHPDEAALVAEGIDLFEPEEPWFLDREEADRHAREESDVCMRGWAEDLAVHLAIEEGGR